MDRRDFLRRGGLAAGIVALSGCTGERLQEAERRSPFEGYEGIDLPVTQRLDIAAAGIERADGAEIRDTDALAAYLDDGGVSVESLEGTVDAGEPLLSLEYAAGEYAGRGLMHHLGAVAGGYAALVEAARGGEKLEASLHDGNRRKFGEYEVRRRWAEAYNDGAFAARRYADEVATTAESTV